jgi:hypothetical protein
LNSPAGWLLASDIRNFEERKKHTLTPTGIGTISFVELFKKHCYDCPKTHQAKEQDNYIVVCNTLLITVTLTRRHK